MHIYPVKFTPIWQERIWGGERLKSWYSVQDPRPIGEYWLVSAHPHAPSMVQNGSLAGMTLPELTARYPEAYLGCSHQPRFPLLLKLIEAADDLSVQVHPDDDYALQAEGDYGKTECWYILDHLPDAEIIYGHRFAHADQFWQAVRENRLHHYLHRQKINRGELVFVPAGTLHAILKGTVLLEIQQTSDVTYRVYDWDRVDAQGNPRTLHIEQAAAVLRYDSPQQTAIVPPTLLAREEGVAMERLVSCPYFTVDRIALEAGRTFVCQPGRPGNPDLLVAVEGEALLVYGQAYPTETVHLQRGEALLVPGLLNAYQLFAETGTTVIRVFY